MTNYKFYIVLLICIICVTNIIKAQYIDTCKVNSNRTYTVEGGQPNSTYQWSINDIVQDVTEINILYQWNEAGNFDIAVSETTEFGCQGKTYTYKVLVSDEIENNEIIIPNVFTPNGDNWNNNFTVTGRNLDYYFIKIYNRWGKVLYQSIDITTAWNGKHNGITCSSGVYYYEIVYKKNDMTKKENGFLHLFN